MKIPMLDLKREYEYMKADIDAAIARCLDHQKWILGPEVREFEGTVARYLNVKYCIGMSSGTDALVLALRALAIKTKGQEYFDRSDLIITTPFTFTATGDAILRAGATPLFVDIDPATFNIDPTKVSQCLKNFPDPSRFTPDASLLTDVQRLTPDASRGNIVGILPVHLYGQPCEMDQIMSIANEYGLFVVEDCAQAFGAEWLMVDGKRSKVGSIGNVGCFSFFPSKNLGGFGDAGMVSTNDDELDTLIRMLTKHGGKDKYNVDYIGYNGRLDTLQAAILTAKFKYIDEFNARRRHIGQLYAEGLKDVPGIVLPLAEVESPLSLSPAPLTQGFSVVHQFTLRVLNGQRDLLQQHLRASGIDSMVYYPIPLHAMRVFKSRCAEYGELSEAEQAARQVLSLPIEPLMGAQEIAISTDAVKSKPAGLTDERGRDVCHKD
jgi:UDP-2-acetamido-2-deoxy-ribo-hexuluronate aminotransferase